MGRGSIDAGRRALMRCRSPRDLKRDAGRQPVDRTCLANRPWAFYSHSIINGFSKPLIRLYDISNLAGFTVRCTATSRGIPALTFHHQSTSIEDSRRVHDGQLSRSIEVYRVHACAPEGVSKPLAPRDEIKKTPASNALSCCPVEPLRQNFCRHYTPLRCDASASIRRVFLGFLPWPDLRQRLRTAHFRDLSVASSACRRSHRPSTHCVDGAESHRPIGGQKRGADRAAQERAKRSCASDQGRPPAVPGQGQGHSRSSWLSLRAASGASAAPSDKSSPVSRLRSNVTIFARSDRFNCIETLPSLSSLSTPRASSLNTPRCRISLNTPQRSDAINAT